MLETIFCPAGILLCLLALAAGLAMFLHPSLCIELQRRFYAKINWRIEPISMAKEIRNTRLMGLALISAAPLSVFCIKFFR
ncbi:MAG: hypothetical protein WC572_02945 [Candidatus Omnitrophota bacterium]